MKLVSIVVPMYNEKEMVNAFLEALTKELSAIKGYEFEIVAVNDGSKDNTLELLKLAQDKYKNLVVVNLSRNFGHEPAVDAGLNTAKGDAVIPMDADLQDPPSVIPQLIAKWEEGYEVVNAHRASRKDDGVFKRVTASMFYKLIAKMSGKVKVERNVGHFRLISRRVCDKVIALHDSVRVFRVEVPYVGFKTTSVDFVRPPRLKGETHYNIQSMSNLALDSIIITTTYPLKFITRMTIAMIFTTILSILAELVFFILSLCSIVNFISEVGYFAWLIINVMGIIGAFIMVSLAIISQYNARSFTEAQSRPFYIIDEISSKKE